MKKILLVVAVVFAFASCKKEELEPATQPTIPTNTPIASVDMSLAKNGAFSGSGSMTILGNSGSMSGAIWNCGSGVGLDEFTFNVDEVYSVTFAIDLTQVYAGDIMFVEGTWPNVDLVEVTGNTSGTATLGVQQCNAALGDQLVVYQ